ncbi:MAG: hypothetical protein JXR07_13785 [Reichenbachiella sp.]
MNIRKRKILFLLISWITFSCQSNNSDKNNNSLKISNIASHGCIKSKNIHPNQGINELDSLVGKNEMQITDLLGVPSRTQLYDRGQKFFFYKINCDSLNVSKNSLRIRFNALSYVNEVLITETN